MKLLLALATLGYSLTASADFHFEEFTLTSRNSGTLMANPFMVCDHHLTPSSYAYQTVVGARKFLGTIHIENPLYVNCGVEEGSSVVRGRFADLSTDNREGCAGEFKITVCCGAKYTVEFIPQKNYGGKQCNSIGTTFKFDMRQL